MGYCLSVLAASHILTVPSCEALTNRDVASTAHSLREEHKRCYGYTSSAYIGVYVCVLYICIQSIFLLRMSVHLYCIHSSCINVLVSMYVC